MTPNRSPRLWLRLLRGCGCACTSVICWCLWLHLAILLGFLAIVLLSRDLAAPDFLLRRFEQKLASADFRARFGATHFDPGGRILLEEVELYSGRLNEPLFSARAVLIELDFWNLLTGDFDADEIRVSGGTLFCPAFLSPTGTAEALVDGLQGAFTRERQGWTIDQLTFRSRDLAVAATGRIPAHPGVRLTPESPGRIAESYLKRARQAAGLLRQLEGATQPRLWLSLTPTDSGRVLCQADFSAEEWRHSGALRLAGLRGTTRFLLDATRIDEILLSAEAVEFSNRFSALSPTVVLRGLQQRQGRPFQPEAAWISLPAVQTPQLNDLAAWGHLRLDKFPQVRWEGAVRSGAEVMALTGTADLGEQTASLAIDGRPDSQVLQLVADRVPPHLWSRLSLTEPPRLRGTVEFAPGWKPASAHATVEVADLVAQGVRLDGAAGEVRFAEGALEVSELRLRAGESNVRGSYWSDTKSGDYRFLLKGEVRPHQVSTWFRPWWSNFWRHFQFNGAPLSGDVDIRARWGHPHLTAVFGRAEASSLQLRTLELDRLRARFFIRPGFYDVLSLEADRNSGSAEGAFSWKTRAPPSRELEQLTVDLRSTLDLAQSAGLFGEAGSALVAPYQLSQPPSLHLQGSISKGVRDLTVQISAAAPLLFHHVPLQKVEATARLKGDTLTLDPLTFGFAGGSGSALVHVSGASAAPEISLDGSIKQGQLALAAEAWRVYQSHRQGNDSPAPSGKTASGLFNLSLSAKGPLDNPLALRGAGVGEVRQAELGNINLFGLLSALLRGTIFDFSTLQLTDAEGSFVLDGPKLAFQSLRLTGPRAAIEAEGDYLLPDRSLDFSAKVFPFRESNFPLIGIIGAVLEPLSYALEVRLSGTLEDPNWRFVLGPGNMLREMTRPASELPSLEPDSGAAPPVPATDATSPDAPPAAEARLAEP